MYKLESIYKTMIVEKHLLIMRGDDSNAQLILKHIIK